MNCKSAFTVTTAFAQQHHCYEREDLDQQLRSTAEGYNVPEVQVVAFIDDHGTQQEATRAVRNDVENAHLQVKCGDTTEEANRVDGEHAYAEDNGGACRVQSVVEFRLLIVEGQRNDHVVAHCIEREQSGEEVAHEGQEADRHRKVVVAHSNGLEGAEVARTVQGSRARRTRPRACTLALAGG
eukprot:CAMPEP_0115856694 /NCGR_PEP_ID=MMETSP0287-20121206/15186_1 /TAXON_ID=412157 /ORGANISM="Chrysochromulina rotalis, Strain UIO044" /LENGTH=182 /DNA_ID=CAMNT_0003310879 /DNA_START=262 /DNA_END=807 /DNA_ORIENTATION=-